MAIFKPKVWHPVAKLGSGKQDGSPITKNMRFAASFRFLFLHYFMVLLHSVQPYFVTGWQIDSFKIAALGARALLAMTNLAGFAEKRGSSWNEKGFYNGRISPRSHTRPKDEFHCAALPCLVPGCRFAPFKIAASGARALLAMTNLVGFAGKRDKFQNEKVPITAEFYCAATLG